MGSGSVKVSTSNAGSNGVSGSLTFSSGTSSSGTTGSITVSTGSAVNGKGGSIILSVGQGNVGNGGSIAITAGKTTAGSSRGGDVSIVGGQGTSGNGGYVYLEGGTGSSNGGNVYIKAGSGNVQGTIYFQDASNSVKMEISDSSITVSTALVVQGTMTTSSTFAVGSDPATRATISNIYTGTFYNNNNIGANSEYEKDISVSGVSEGDIVIVSPTADSTPGDTSRGVLWNAWAKNNYITVRFSTVTAYQYQADGNWRYLVIKANDP